MPVEIMYHKTISFIIFTLLSTPLGVLAAISASPVSNSGLYLPDYASSAKSGPTLSNFPTYAGDFTIEAYVYFPYSTDDFDFFLKDDFCRVVVEEDDVYTDYYNFQVTIGTGEAGKLTGLRFFKRKFYVYGGWRHLAITFNSSDNLLNMYLDGDALSYDATINQTINNPTTNITINRGFTYTPYIDEMRVSNVIRYIENNFTPPTAPFTADTNSSALYHFDELSGSTTFNDNSGNNNHLTGSDGARTAVLTRNLLTVERPGSGAGTINMVPGDYTCAYDSSNCAKSFEEGTSVTLTAHAEEDSVFTGWDGSGCSGTESCVLSMNNAVTIVANFSSVTVLEGDVNGDEVVDLADVITVLKILSNSVPGGQELNPTAAVSLSNTIGMADAIFITNLLSE